MDEQKFLACQRNWTVMRNSNDDLRGLEMHDSSSSRATANAKRQLGSLRKGRRLVTDSTVVSIGTADISKLIAQAGAVQRKFSSDFGNGTTAVTSAPTADHDYFTAPVLEADYGIFRYRARRLPTMSRSAAH